MPDKMGIIGNTHGVSASNNPKPKKLASSTQKPPLNKPAITASSDCGAGSARAADDCATNGEAGAAAPAGLNAASVSSAFCSCGG
jgi:hypothetical protein